MGGVHASVCLLAAAFWDPVLSRAVGSVWDALLVAVVFAALRFVPPWMVVPAAAGLGTLSF